MFLPLLHGPRPVYPEGGRGIRLEGQAQEAAIRPRRGARVLQLPQRSRPAHLLEQHAALRRAVEARSRRRRHGVLRLHRDRPRIGFGARVRHGGGPRARSARHSRRPRRHRALADGRVFDTADPETGMSFAEAVQTAEAAVGTVGTVGSYTPPQSAGRYRGAGVGPSPAYSYSAAVAEVEVDPETGIVTVPCIWIAYDVGQCINAAAVMGQVEGSIYMGLGEALMEEMSYRENRNVVHKIPSMLEYKSPTTLEMCDVVTYLIEDPDPNGPFGAKEVGQGPLLPVAPAIANAVYDAVGVRIDEIPITPEKVLRAIKGRGKGEAGRVGPTRFPDIPWPEPIRVPPPWEGGDGRAKDSQREPAGGVGG